jgi:hypothetical protein
MIFKPSNRLENFLPINDGWTPGWTTPPTFCAVMNRRDRFEAWLPSDHAFFMAEAKK